MTVARLLQLSVAGLMVVCLISGPLAAQRAASSAGDDLPADVQDLLVFGPLRPLIWRLHVTLDGKPFHDVWQRRLQAVLDENGGRDNRSVTVAQAADVVRGMNGSLSDRDGAREHGKALAELADREGKIDVAAVRNYVRENLPPLVLHYRAPVGRGSGVALFPLLDADGDRQLAASEFDTAAERFRQRDFNDDGIITRAELIVDAAALAVADPASPVSELPVEKAPVMVLDGSTTPAEIARRMLSQYDRNGDGSLTLAGTQRELHLPRTLETQLDANRDGVLDSAELGRFCQHTAEIELPIAMGKASAADNRAKPRTSQPEFRVRKTLLGGYELKLGEVNARLERDNYNPEEVDPGRFRTLDRDNNGYLDATETQAANFSQAVLTAMDSDGDGKIFKAELQSALDQQGTAAAARLQIDVIDLGQNLFDLLDLDQDGALSQRELRTAREILLTHDVNGDSLLNNDEIPQALELEISRGVDSRPDPTGRVGGSRSGQSTNSAGPLWFRKMDRNGDGDVEPREFLGPRRAFDTIDTNHDGLIDREEAEAVRE